MSRYLSLSLSLSLSLLTLETLHLSLNLPKAGNLISILFSCGFLLCPLLYWFCFRYLCLYLLSVTLAYFPCLSLALQSGFLMTSLSPFSHSSLLPPYVSRYMKWVSDIHLSLPRLCHPILVPLVYPLLYRPWLACLVCSLCLISQLILL